MKLITACPRESQVRFEDHCYEYASNNVPMDIISNIDACKDKTAELWVPGTSAEHHFVSQTFPSDNNTWHFGILTYSKMKGFYGVDNSHHVGSSYFTLDTDVNAVEGDLINKTIPACLVFEKQNGGVWKYWDPCTDAVGVCKSKLGE